MKDKTKVLTIFKMNFSPMSFHLLATIITFEIVFQPKFKFWFRKILNIETMRL